MAYALGLPAALRARGLTVEVVPGWETRSAGSFNPKGAVAHWTAGPARSTTRPSLNIVINGRPGLDGPLANVYGARDGVAIVVAAGRANHAGVGSWRGLVGNSAVFGTEMEGADASDFTQAQRWAYPRIHAAYCDLGGFGPDMNCGHSEWAGPRKRDINGYTPAILRRDIAAVLGGTATTTPAQEDDMAQADIDEIQRKLSLLLDVAGTPRDSRERTPGEQVWQGRIGYGVATLTGQAQTADAVLAEVFANSRATLAAVSSSDPAAVAAALLPGLKSALSAASAGPIDQAQIEAAFRSVLGSLG